MGRTIPHDDRYERGRNAINRIANGFTELYAIWLETQRDQARAVEVSREIAPAQRDDGELLTTTQLAKRLNYSTRTIQKFKIEGMPFIGEGRSTRFELSKALEWIKTHRGKNNRVSTASNGKVPQAPIKTRLQASHRR